MREFLSSKLSAIPRDGVLHLFYDLTWRDPFDFRGMPDRPWL
jgi:hypothetical protein